MESRWRWTACRAVHHAVKAELKVRVRHLELNRLEFVGTDLPGKIDLALTGMDAGWSSQDGPPTGFVKIDRADLQIPGLNPITLGVAARLVVDDGIDIPSWTVNADGINLRGQGRLGGEEGTTFAAAGAIDLATLDEIVKAGGILSGSIDIDASFQPTEDQPLRVDVRSRHIEAAGFPLDECDRPCGSRGGWSPRRSRPRHLSSAGGSTAATPSAPSAPASPTTSASTAAESRLPEFSAASASPRPASPPSSTLMWKSTGTESAFPLGQGRADVVFLPTEGPLPASGPLLVELKGDRALTFTTDALQIGSSILSWQGPLAIGSWEPSWSITATPAVLEEVGPMVNAWIGSRALPAVEGSGRLQVSLSGPWQELVVNARLDARPLRWGPISLDHAVVSALIAGGRLTLDPSRFILGDGSGEVEGSLTWNPQAGDEQLALDLRGHRLPMANIAEWAGQDGMADGAFSFTGGLRGPLDLPRGSWAAGLADVTIAGLELGDATATIDLADGRFEARGLDFDDGLQGRVWWKVTRGEIGGDLAWGGMPLDFLGETMTRTIGDTADVHLVGQLTPEGGPAGTLVAETEAGNIEVNASSDSWVVRGRLADALDGSVELTRSAGRSARRRRPAPTHLRPGSLDEGAPRLGDSLGGNRRDRD